MSKNIPTFLMALIWLLPLHALSAAEIDYLPPSPVNETAKEPSWWINYGIGGVLGVKSNVNKGLSTQLSFNGNLTEHLVLTVYSDRLLESTDRLKTSRGIMFGYIERNPEWYWSLSSGISTSDSFYRSQTYQWLDMYQVESAFGIPVQAQAFWTPFKHFGIGVIGHLDVSKQVNGSLLLGFQVYA